MIVKCAIGLMLVKVTNVIVIAIWNMERIIEFMWKGLVVLFWMFSIGIGLMVFSEIGKWLYIKYLLETI